jgi:pilus assembly protein CpaC
MLKYRTSRAGGALAVAVLSTGLFGLRPAESQDPVTLQDPVKPRTPLVAQLRHFRVTRDKSITFAWPTPFASAVAGNADIADVLPMSDRQIYIQGKRIGTTNIMLYDQSKSLVGVIDVDVTLDIEQIKDRILSGTESRGIRVSVSKDQIVLSGVARNAVDADRAVAIARSLVTTDDGKEVESSNADKYIINSMRVAPSQQVMLRVRFVEVDRTAERDIGVNWFGANKGALANIGSGGVLPGPITQAGATIPTTQGGMTTVPTQGGVPLLQTLGTLVPGGLSTAAASTPFGVGLFKLAGGNIDLLISALESKGQARRLAEPDLVALSGDTASFLAGGEYPVPSVQSSSGTAPVITTQYYPYGVQLTFVPTVLATGIINLRLNPSVSELDYTNSVVISGTAIPSITKRETRTTIEMRDGQSFAIAGLLQSNNAHDINQVPWLGSVPILGTLFSSKSYQANETDLVVIVTPHLVAPAAPGQVMATPLDKELPPNDMDFFLGGKPSVRKQYTDFVTSGGGTAGPYGYIMPLSAK